eukprot:scaffold2125_cov79-Skeletonema_dohrnii-CCMP3373.AAC.3
MHLYLIPARYWIATASIIFLLLPGSSNLLYVDSGKYGSSILSNSCTTRNEWLWIGTISLLLVIPHRKYAPRCCASTKVIRPKISWVQINVVWYLAALIGPCLWRPDMRSMSFIDWTSHVGAQAAWPAMFDMSIILFPTTRLSHLLDFYYFGSSDTIGTVTFLADLHTKASLTMALWIAVHTIMLSIVYFIRDIDAPYDFLEQMLPLTLYLSEGIVNFSGWMGGAMLLFLWTSARSSFYKKWYNALFVPLHTILAITFLLACNLHDYNSLLFAWPVLAELMVDRLMRIFSDSYYIDHSSIEAQSLPNNSESALLLNLSKPHSWNLKPGYHVYLQSYFDSSEWHPFTIASIDQQNEKFSLHIKARGDWTNKVVESLLRQSQDLNEQEDDTRQAQALPQLKMKGPYGPDLNKVFDRATSVIFVAGGIGVAGLTEAIHKTAELGIPFTVIWLVHTTAEMQAIGAPLLWNRRLIETLTDKDDCEATFKVFVTAEAEEECPTRHGLSNGIAQYDCKLKVSDNSSEPSVYQVTLIVLICMALSFLMARQLCCYKRVPNTMHEKTCGLAYLQDSTCQYCSEDIDMDSLSLPCCTIGICYICFRGLTVLMVIFLSPLLASLVLYTRQKFLLWRRNQYHNPGQVAEKERVTSDIDEIDPSDMIRHRLISVKYQRPNIATVLQELWKSHDDAVFASKTTVMTCGPQRLVDDIRREVKQQQNQNFDNEYRLIVL